jgi:hypothetical protein
MKTTILTILVLLAGCRNFNQRPVIVLQANPETETMLVVEANQYEDASNDFYSYHAVNPQGIPRDREPTVEEIAVFELEQAADAADRAKDPDRATQLREKQKELQRQYAQKFTDLALDDKRRHDAKVLDMIREAKEIRKTQEAATPDK